MKAYKPSDVGVIGLGYVGSQVRKWFRGSQGHSRSKPNWKRVDQKKTIFLCLPTPHVDYKKFDLSALEENIARLSPGKSIVIKSTVLPGTTAMFAKKYGMHRFFFNPEFLTARTARKDYLAPHAQYVGYVTDQGNPKREEQDRKTADKILFSLPTAPVMGIMDSKEAEMLKLIRNNTLALRVIWANEVYDYCKQKGVDYKTVIHAMTNRDPFLAPTHWDIDQDGFRGFGGACFPKDTAAFDEDSESELIRVVRDLNHKYRNQ